MFSGVKASIEALVLTHGSQLLASPFVPSRFVQGVAVLAERHNRPFIASINVINFCNLKCAGCYWSKVERRQQRDEMTISQGDQLLSELWTKGVRQFLFLGGEPMMRREELSHWVQTVADLGGISTIITNATYGLPAPGEWRQTHYMVSCDGDQEGMRKIRGLDTFHNNAPVFDLVKSATYGRKDVVLAMTVSKANVDRIEPFVRETRTWGIGGIVFSFATPNVGEEQSFYLPDERKEEAVQELLRLKAETGDFIVMSKRAIELLRPAEVAQWHTRCPTYAAVSIRADGKPLERCIFGPEGDCSRCGCNVSTSFVALREGDKETARMVLLPARRAGVA
jgi:MoaA/NifB/PqqE/SkfB family radical SAM enzyme